MPHFTSREEYERWKAERLGKPYVPVATTTPEAGAVVASGPAGTSTAPAARPLAAGTSPAAVWARTPVPGPAAAAAAAAPPKAPQESASATTTAAPPPAPRAAAARRPTPAATPAAGPGPSPAAPATAAPAARPSPAPTATPAPIPATARTPIPAAARTPTPAPARTPIPAPTFSVAKTRPRVGLLVLACVLLGGASLYLFAIEDFVSGAFVVALGGLVAGVYWYFKLRPHLDDRDYLMTAFGAAARTALRGHVSGEDVAAVKGAEDAARARHEAAKPGGA